MPSISTASAPQRLVLLGGLFANFGVFGATITLMGATAPGILRQLQWSYTELGAVMAVDSAGYLLATFAGGVLVRRIGAKLILVGGLALAGLGLAGFGIWPGLPYNIACISVVGLGQGSIEIATNYSLVRLERDGSSRLMNLLHAAFTVGAVAGPLVIGALFSWGLEWRHMFRGSAALTLGLALFFSLVSFTALDQRTEASTSTRQVLRQLGRQPLVGIFALFILIYVGVEIGISNWLAEYYVEVFDASEAAGAYMVSLFWGGLLVGRLGVSLLYRSHRQAPLLLGLTLTAVLGLLIAMQAGHVWVVTAAFAACGLGMSAIYPLIMVLTGRCGADQQSLAIGVVATAGGIGALTFPGLMSLLAEHYGLARGFWLYALSAVFMGLLAVEIRRRVGLEEDAA
jgi:fucose permease